MQIKNRNLSYFLLFIIYVAASALGIWVYAVSSGEFWLRLLLADVAATVFTFVFSLIFANASVYDPYWSVQPIVILTAFALGQSMNLSRILLLIAVWIWGLRLTANWAYTFHGLHCQDWRYTMLHEQTGIFYPVINFVGIHMVPTVIVYACILPAVFAMQYDVQSNLGSVIFFLLSLGAVTLQGTADVQMHRFRKQKIGGFIRCGVWKHSRHPNYLGEILMWWGIGLSVVSVMPKRWYLLGGALANTLLFAFVSIPLAEKRQSKKPNFDQYRTQTRVLLPIPKNPHSAE